MADKEYQQPPRRPCVLIILDGYGVNPGRLHNAVANARTPRMDEYYSHNPHAVLQAAGRAVGLPTGQMGNSEVGHTTIGAGAIVRQDLVRIGDAIDDGSFYENPVLCAAAQHAADRNRPLHLIGLVSDGGVHSHIRHLLALIDLCKRESVRPVVHMITDGRDTPPQSALVYVEQLESALREAGGQIMTVAGRFYAMDRDRRWDRTEAAWKAMVRSEGRGAPSARSAIEQAYAQGETDEFIKPTVIQGAESIAPGDQAVFFNFRNDRSRQLTYALCGGEEFVCFDRGDYQPITVTCLTEYDARFRQPVAFQPEYPAMTLGEVVARAGVGQFRCAETEKYAHVTFFLNGGREEPYPLEDREMIPSPKVHTYDETPAMSAREVTDAVLQAMDSRRYGLVVVNFANGDMVAHTAKFDAVVQAVEAVDEQVGRILDKALETGFSAVLTADHGNCEELVDPITGEPHTQHTVYPVPFLVVDEQPWQLATGGGLSNIAPTVLQIMGLEQPVEMTGDSLLIKPVPLSEAQQQQRHLATG